jgi:hypothetical protein
MLGQGRGEDQCSDPRTQIEEKYYTNPKCIKRTQELKKMQAELITTQTHKQEWQTQIEPLQEWVAEVLA